MSRWWRCAAGGGGAALGLALAAAPAGSQVAGGDEWSLNVGGYVRTLAGGQDFGYDPLFTDRRSAFTSQVVRLKWLLDVGGRIRVSAHNRLLQLASTSSSEQDVLGIGVSAVPDRSVELESELIDRDHVRLWHDLDRLSATVFLTAVDLTVGRQAITWGIASLFPVADLWAQFSPYELDTEEKPGADAVRALLYPTGGLELDLVVADRGELSNLSAGARATLQLSFGDVYLGAGKFWREVIALGGVSVLVDAWKLRAEWAVPWEVDRRELLTPRATAGADWISSDLQLTLEYHLNGLGTTRSEDYAALLTSDELARGETYYLGHHYLGAAGSYGATDRLSLALASLINLNDPSLSLLPSVNYDMGQAVRINLGGLVPLGATPTFPADGLPRLESEFGTYGAFGYGQVSIYF